MLFTFEEKQHFGAESQAGLPPRDTKGREYLSYSQQTKTVQCSRRKTANINNVLRPTADIFSAIWVIEQLSKYSSKRPCADRAITVTERAGLTLDGIRKHIPLLSVLSPSINAAANVSCGSGK
jgi:hypothetical protein